MVAELATLALVIVAAAAERLHWQRCRRIAPLAFGPRRRPRAWVYVAPVLRVAALGALGWGFITLIQLPPKVHQVGTIPDKDQRHLLLVLDVSPSMRLVDAGPTGKQSRTKRVSDLLESFFERVPLDLYRVSIIATYNGAKPVVVDTRDMEVVRNILNDLPMHFAFPKGKTDIFAGLEEAAKMAHPWNPRSTTLLLFSDGDTVPGTGMPRMPPSVSHTVVVGVGDHQKGMFIDGHHSRQDMSTLRSVAIRLGGTYHNGNEKHLSTALVTEISGVKAVSIWEKLTKREYALLAISLGATMLSLLPLALHFAGTSWQAGVPTVAKRTEKSPRQEVQLLGSQGRG